MAEDKRPEQREANYLLLGNFVSNSPSSTKYAKEFYQYLDEASQNKKAHKLIREKDLANVVLEDIAYKDVPLGRYQTQINAAFNDMRKVEDNTKLTPKEKKVKLDEIQRFINAKYKFAVEQVRKSKAKKIHKF